MLPRAQVVRFGPFQLDPQSAELYRDGTKVKLSEQPFQILSELVEHAGQVVTREELRQRLWQSNTFVDFENGINTAVKHLRDALADSAENPHYIETLPRHGYRLLVPVETIGPPGPTTRSAGRWRICVTGAVLALLAFSGLVWYRARLERPRPWKVESLAVLPLVNLSGNPDDDYFCDAMTVMMIAELGKVHALRVISRQSVMQYRGTTKTVSQITRELHVDALVEGSALRASGKIRITVQLIQANPERHLWSETYERNLGDMIALQREIVQAIVREIRAFSEDPRPHGP